MAEALPFARLRMTRFEQQAPGSQSARLASVDHEPIGASIGGKGEVVPRKDGEDPAHLIVADCHDGRTTDMHAATDRSLTHDALEEVMNHAKQRISQDLDRGELFDEHRPRAGGELRASCGTNERIGRVPDIAECLAASQ
jgi:hypothetical protein